MFGDAAGGATAGAPSKLLKACVGYCAPAHCPATPQCTGASNEEFALEGNRSRPKQSRWRPARYNKSNAGRHDRAHCRLTRRRIHQRFANGIATCTLAGAGPSCRTPP